MSQNQSGGGSVLLKIISIVMPLPAVLSILICVANINRSGSMYDSSAADTIRTASTILLVASVLQILAGVIGLISWKRPSMATFCIILGVLLILMILFGNVMMIASNPSSFFMIFSGSAPAVIYIIGAVKLQKTK